MLQTTEPAATHPSGHPSRWSACDIRPNPPAWRWPWCAWRARSSCSSCGWRSSTSRLLIFGVRRIGDRRLLHLGGSGNSAAFTFSETQSLSTRRRSRRFRAPSTKSGRRCSTTVESTSSSVPNLSPRIQLTSYFGIRALLIEGGAIADMTTPASRPQLLFLLGTYFGAFKAKHDRWAVTELVLDSAGIRTILAPFVAPWLRTTVYTGDQIAYACSRDFRASLAAVYRVLVGRELTPQLAASGLILQAGRVSKSSVLRVAEMLRPEPHATNRFLNLVRFAQQVDPESVLAFRAGLSPEINGVLDEALARMTRAGRRNTAAALVTAGAVVLSAMLVVRPSPAPAVPKPTPPASTGRRRMSLSRLSRRWFLTRLSRRRLKHSPPLCR